MSQPITKMETVQAVDRAFELLELVSRENGLNLNALREKTGLSKPTLSRLVFTLTENGYLEKLPDGTYNLTLKLYEVGINSMKNLNTISLVNSTLADLNKITGRISQFSIVDGTQLLCIQSIGQQESSFSVYTNVGNRSPLYCTSAGKAILSTWTSREVLEQWDKMDVKKLTENTITDSQEFLKELSRTRERQYALDNEENEYNVFCVGAPVMDLTGKPIGAVSVSGKTLTPEEEAFISREVITATRRLSGLLGYLG